jgi:hypothetical protein
MLQGSNVAEMFLSTKTDAQYIFFDIYFSIFVLDLSSDFAFVYFHPVYIYTGISL